MKYTQPSFTLPAGPGNITQKEWDRIWRKESTPLEIFDAAVNCPHCNRALELTPSEGGCVCLVDDEVPLEETEESS